MYVASIGVTITIAFHLEWILKWFYDGYFSSQAVINVEVT